MTRAQSRVGAVVLTYNSADDLPDCLAGLRAQRGVDLRVIVVDNASKLDERARMKAIFHEVLPEGLILAAKPASYPDASAVFLCNDVNAGYSAGNNIGARFAAESGCEAVLIVNPDVRIEDPDYLANLFDLITADAKTAVACSTVTNLFGKHENPMIEPGFVEELLWPVKMVFGRLLPRQRAVTTLPARALKVEKVTGACFLIRMDFLRVIRFFDESVFLYCEESILYAQVRATGWKMLMNPGRHALHAHRTTAKGDQLTRYQNWARSRTQFHAAYGGYGVLGQALLAGSRSLVLGLVRMRTLLKRVLSRAAQMRGGA